MLNFIKNNKNSKPGKKIFIYWFVLWFVLAGVLFPVSKIVQAEVGLVTEFAVPTGAGVPVTDIGVSIFDRIVHWYNISTKFIDKAIDEIGSTAFKTSLQIFLNNLAYNSATKLVTGGKGADPLFVTDWRKWMEKQGYMALGDFVNNTLGKMWGKDLCEPLNPVVKAKLEFYAIKGIYEPIQPRCDFRKIVDNIEALGEMEAQDLVKFSHSFETTGHDLGILLHIMTAADTKKQLDKKEEEWITEITGVFKNIVSPITNEIKTPGKIIEFDVQSIFSNKTKPQEVYTGHMVADAIGVFANTLAAKMMRYVYDKGFNPRADVKKPDLDPMDYVGYDPGEWSFSGYGDKDYFSDLIKPNLSFNNNYEVLNQLSCDTGTQFSCSINANLRTALEQGERMTLKQAVEQGYVDGSWPVGYRENSKSGGTALVSDSIYSYRTLVIWRKYRIAPVGFELAALYYKDYDRSGRQLVFGDGDRSTKMKGAIELMDEYDNPESPYYKLVDPGWVLTVPETICRRQGFGEFLSGDQEFKGGADLNGDGVISDEERWQMIARRSDYCADERSCVKESADGSSCQVYGYCTQEKEIWRIDTDSCQPIYNSCVLYTTRDNETVSYLSNTLSGKEVCADEQAVGCRQYCSEFDYIEDRWDCEMQRGDIIGEIEYFNASAENCEPDNEGCSQFIRVVNNFDLEGKELDVIVLSNFINDTGDGYKSIGYEPVMTNLLKSPEELDCINFTKIIPGEDENSCPKVWRHDIGQCVQGGSEMCVQYSLYCSSDDAGCEFYEPISYQGPLMPGVVRDDNICPSECVGYSNFLEQDTFFDQNFRPVNLIPSNAGECPAMHNGCERFTSIAEDQTGEKQYYFTQLRSCVDIDDPNAVNYITTESKDGSGIQLRSWRLLKSNLGDYPCTNVDGQGNCEDDVKGAQLCEYGADERMDDPAYNPDCVQFEDLYGQAEWVKGSRVVFASSSCVPLRREVDDSIYYTILSQNEPFSCSAQSVGCREYKGSRSNSVEVVLDDNFEIDGTNLGWDGSTISNESTMAGGHSILAPGDIEKELGEVKSGHSYKFSFWAKSKESSGATISGVSVVYGGEEQQFDGSANVNNFWNYYVFNLKDFVDKYLGATKSLKVEITGSVYIDNIKLVETIDDYYLIKDSWYVPESCDQPSEGAMIGCEQYEDVNGGSRYLKSFDRLCRDELVGCEPVIDTKNSDDLSDDSLEYLVYDPDKVCSQPGCNKYGLIDTVRDVPGEIIISDQYLVIDPDNFSSPISPACMPEQQWCDRFVNSSGGIEYFKYPRDYTCEYKAATDGNYFAWFKSGIESPIAKDICPGALGSNYFDGHCIGGLSITTSKQENQCDSNLDCVDYTDFQVGKGLCSSWAALCPIDQDSCYELQDPSSPDFCDQAAVNGEENACDFYYYKYNNLKQCDQIDIDSGCIGFHAEGKGEDKWYSTARCTKDPSVECTTDSDCILRDLGNCSHGLIDTKYLSPEDPGIPVN